MPKVKDLEELDIIEEVKEEPVEEVVAEKEEEIKKPDNPKDFTATVPQI